MKKNDILIFIFLEFLFSQMAFAQIEGLWTVEKVRVGKEIMTPIAKWTQINQDGTFQSGNGWLQNAEGTWKYVNNKFYSQEMNEIEEGFGAFNIKILNPQKMIWQRIEEGDSVTVEWKKIAKKPTSPADQIVGLWDLIKFEKGGKDLINEFDPKDKYYVFMRWDRVYVERTAEGKRTTGYWFMNAHRPEFVMISQQSEKTSQSWALSFENEKMIWRGTLDANKGETLIFTRLKQFPK